MATPRLSGGRDGLPAVLLVDCAGGGELDIVHETLVRSLHTPAVLIRGADLGSLAVSLDLGTGLLEVDGSVIRPEVVWTRHCATGAIVAQARPAGSVTALAAASWSGLIEHLKAAAGTVLPGNAPPGTTQLKEAEMLGVKTPKTVLTNDVQRARRHLGSRQIIVKTPDFRLFEPNPGHWPECLPAVVSGDAGPQVRAAGGRPVVVQEYVPHLRELRVYYLNGGLCAFEVDKPEPSAMWTDPASVTVTRVECPPAVVAAVRTLSAGWCLRYGAFDLLVSPAGEPVFLEVNPDGDWLWYERRAGWHGVSFMAAVMVHELFARAGEYVAG